MFNWIKKLIWKKDCKYCRWGLPIYDPKYYMLCLNGAGIIVYKRETKLDFTVDDIKDCTRFEFIGF